MKTIKTIFLAAGMAVIFRTAAVQVLAEKMTLSVSPPIIQATIKPGKSILIAYTVENADDPSIVKTGVVSFEPSGNYGHIKLLDKARGPVEFSLDNSDIELGDAFFLRSRQKQQLLVRMKVPEGAAEGDYYYTLLSQAEPPPSLGGPSGSRTRGAVGANIIITVSRSGSLDSQAMISIFSAVPRFKIPWFGKNLQIFDSGDPVPVILTVANTGKNIVQPEGKITLEGKLGNKSEYRVFRQNVLAGSQRTLIATPSAQISGPVRGPSQPTVLINGFFIGVYNLHAELSLTPNSPPLTATSGFIGIPIKLGLIMILSSAIAAVIIRKIKQD